MLGPVEFLSQGRDVMPTAPKARQVVALLMLRYDTVVQASELIDELWQENPPPSAVTTVQTYIYRLRKILAEQGEDALVRTLPGGYSLLVPPDHVDVHRFEREAADGQELLRRGDTTAAARTLGLALSLWRGPALGGVTVGGRLQSYVTRLEELRFRILELRIEADLELGRHRELVSELKSLVLAHPHHEHLHALLMLALHRSGRRYEALELYRSLRRTMLDDLGLEPGRDLTLLHQTLLSDPDQGPPGPTRTLGRVIVSSGRTTGNTPETFAVPTPVPVPVPAPAPAPAPGALSVPAPAQVPAGATVLALAAPPGPSALSPCAAGDTDGALAMSMRRPVPAQMPTPAPTAPAAPATPSVPSLRSAPPLRSADTEGPSQAPAGTPTNPFAVPAQLPYDLVDFVGREAALDELTGALSGVSPGRATTGPAVGVVTGPPGIGKSVLAVHAAHLLRTRFPDRQLYADLRGSSGHPRAPFGVLDEFLRALGVPPVRIPPGAAERQALFRELTAGRGVLVVLDDAASAEQVRPLLPGGPRCAVLVTGRRRMPRPTATAHVVELGPPGQCEGGQLLAGAVGGQRTAREHEAADTIVTLLGRHPLALRAVGGRLAALPGCSLRDMAELLDTTPRILDEVRCGDLDLRPRFDVSYRNLSRTEQAVFRLLGMRGNVPFTAAQAAGVLGWRVPDMERVLETLVDHHLLNSDRAPDGTARYGYAPLVLAYAAELLESTLAEADQSAPVPGTPQRNLDTTSTPPQCNQSNLVTRTFQ
ncbi:hypothetical protein GCM10017771_69570 [Streptomyces capitiformicae]|uniref:OmpR/PhoB-type domain-containing protein n=2 Tax=Streptomyces capitiformicae TaxID=2014920 RepID=A0A919DIM6_9ACTN|nr:hypothetical protein GCM10017771_69570 [Streptomyces capitiformicae]